MAQAKATQISEKLYYKIGEVAEIVGVKPHVLRYWETEFNTLRPSKSKSKHRLYRRKDLDTLLEIKRLLHQERFTIEGARKYLKTLGKESPTAKAAKVTARKPPIQAAGDRTYRNILLKLKKDIESLHKLLCA